MYLKIKDLEQTLQLNITQINNLQKCNEDLMQIIKDKDLELSHLRSIKNDAVPEIQIVSEPTSPR